MQMDYGRRTMTFILKGKKRKWVAESSRVSLANKGAFEEEGNVESQPPAGDRRAEQAHVADRSGEVDPG